MGFKSKNQCTSFVVVKKLRQAGRPSSLPDTGLHPCISDLPRVWEVAGQIVGSYFTGNLKPEITDIQEIYTKCISEKWAKPKRAAARI